MPRPQTGIPLLSISTGEGNLGINGCIKNKRILNANCTQGRTISILFYASDRDGPYHIHVERDDKVAKYWLDPIRLQNSGGFTRVELKEIQAILSNNRDFIVESWNEYFGH